MRCPGRAIGGPIRVPASTLGKRPAPSARTAANRPTPPPSSQAPSISPTALDTSMMVPSSCITAGRSAPASPTRNSFIRPLPDLKARALYQRLPPAPARRLVLSLAHDVSGLGSTRVVRFGLSVGRDRDEPDAVATGTQDADVSECAGALAGTTPVCAGGGGDAGDERAQLPPLPAPLRGRWPGRIVRPKARQGVRAPRAGRPDRMGARAVPNPPYGLDGQALPRPSLRPPWLRLELHLDQDHLAARRLQGTQARRPPSPAPAQALRRHDAPSGRLTP